MVVRDVYSEDEKKMLADFNAEADKIPGWADPPIKPVATEESINSMALAVDCWNPLWNDQAYAAGTRWGSIIAPPFYEERFSFHMLNIRPTAEVGIPTHTYIGDDIEIFKPIHVGDSIKVWRRRPKLIDTTDADGKGTRRFRFLAIDLDHINQRDEIVSTFKTYIEYDILSEPQSQAGSMPEYRYTNEELEMIERIENEEEIRGSDIRYWEDVKTGEDIKPVILGPTTLWDLIVLVSGIGRPCGSPLPIREMRKRLPGEIMPERDPVTGVSHAMVEVHYSQGVTEMAGNPRPFHYGVQARQLMARLVTNWMGNDGFIRKFNWRHFSRTPVGDTIIGRGRVVNKHIKNGKHSVDIAVCLENLRGNITEAAMVTVELFSKEAI